MVKGDGVSLSAYNAEFNPPLTSGDEPLTYGGIIPKKVKITLKFGK